MLFVFLSTRLHSAKQYDSRYKVEHGQRKNPLNYGADLDDFFFIGLARAQYFLGPLLGMV